MSAAPNRIRELRSAANLSQQALGERIGVTKVTISDLERGNMKLTDHYMRRVAAALGVPLPDLLLPGDNPFSLSAEEMRLIDLFRGGNDEQRATIQRVVEAIAPPEDARREEAA